VKCQLYRRLSLTLLASSAFCQSSSTTRHSMQSLHMVVGLFLSRVRLPGTACATNCVNRC